MHNAHKILKIALINVLFSLQLQASEVRSLQHAKRTPKVSFVGSVQDLEKFGGLNSQGVAVRRAMQRRRNFKRVVTAYEMDTFRAMTDAQLKADLAEIIPLPQVLQMDERYFRDQILSNPEQLASVLSDTVMMAGDFSSEIFNRFFDVVCASAQVLDQYEVWLRVRFIPAVIDLLKDRLLDIQGRIHSQQNERILNLEMWRQGYARLAYIEQDIVADARSNQRAVALACVPVAVSLQQALPESRAVRWISYAAFAGLTARLLYRYSEIMDAAERKRERLQREETIFRERQAKARALVVPEITVIDDVIGRLVIDLHQKIKDFIAEEKDRLQGLSEREEEKRLALAKDFEHELAQEEFEEQRQNVQPAPSQVDSALNVLA